MTAWKYCMANGFEGRANRRTRSIFMALEQIISWNTLNLCLKLEENGNKLGRLILSMTSNGVKCIECCTNIATFELELVTRIAAKQSKIIYFSKHIAYTCVFCRTLTIAAHKIPYFVLRWFFLAQVDEDDTSDVEAILWCCYGYRSISLSAWIMIILHAKKATKYGTTHCVQALFFWTVGVVLVGYRQEFCLTSDEARSR